MQKLYSRINWENKPSIKTLLNEQNLNRMDAALDAVDDRVISQDSIKANKTDLNDLVSSWSLDEETGIITITKVSGEKILFDLNIEKIPVGFSLSKNGILTMTTDDGTEFTANIGSMIPVLTFADSDEIAVSVSGSGLNKTYSFSIKTGSITGDKLQPNYLADIKMESAKAEASKNSASQSADNAAESAEEAREYAEQSQDIYDNFSQSGNVTGVKGDAEAKYRVGDVNITKDNIGLGNVGNFKAVSTTNSQTLSVAEKANARNNMGIGTAYTANNKNYPVKSNGIDMYVNVPWTDLPDGLTSGYVRTGQRSGESIGAWSTLEGSDNIASGNSSHAEGYKNIASGNFSHAGGQVTVASGIGAQALGYEVKATNHSSFACGKWGKDMTDGSEGHTQVGDLFIIGNGTRNTKRSNALRITQLGDILGTKAFQSSGADYAEFKKPWADNNPDSEDRVGYFVTIKNGLLYKANEGDYITGITSGNPSVVGNADEDYYWRYERDEFNRIVMEDAPEMVQMKDDEGKPVFDEETHEPIMIETGNVIKNARMKFADDYDSSKQDEYIPREKRKEWDYVGMCGVIPVRDDGTCLPDHYCKCGQDGIATLATEREFDTFYVIERLSENVISVDFK